MAERKSLAELLSETPKLIGDLVKAEIDHLKSEVTAKVAKIGVGVGLLAAAGLLALYLLGWLFVVAFEAFKLFAAPWLAALLVVALIVVVLAVLVIIGLVLLRQNKDFSNLEAVGSIKDDVNMVRGLGHAGDGTDPLADLPDAKGDFR